MKKTAMDHRHKMARASSFRILDCMKKRSFASMEEANQFTADHNLATGAYFCMFCEKFHLTRSKGTRHTG